MVILDRYYKFILLSAIASTKILAAPVSTDGCSATDDPVSTCRNYLKYGVLGDSWASGVAYLANNQWDDNSAGSMRTNQAYAVQMDKDLSWANGNQNLQFPACSGSKLVNIAQGANSQISQLTNPDLIIMTIGGNDAGFGRVAESCIYQQANRSYGPAYADDTTRVGDCAMAIDSARTYIMGSNPGEFLSDLKLAIQAVLQSPQALLNPDLRIYQTGYVHFFNLDDDWCNDESFGANLFGNQPKLSHQLRADINDIVDKMNNQIRAVTSSFSAQHVGYVSITEAFDGHRFCEAGQSHTDQYYNNNVWIWNLSYPWLVANATNPSPSTEVTLDGNDVYEWSGGKGTVEDGWMQRPFHPKEAGHQSIMQSIIAQLKADDVPGVRQ